MNAKDFFGDGWSKVIPFKELDRAIIDLNSKNNFTPNPSSVFKAFKDCDYNDLKVVILGQDPYPQNGVATGVAFANSKNTLIKDWSPSLKVLYASAINYSEDLPLSDSVFPTLDLWSKQGVLLLNSALTVEVDNPGSHTLLWRDFIKNFLINLSQEKECLVYALLGINAKSFKDYINENSNDILYYPHPSYCSRNKQLIPGLFRDIDTCLEAMGKDKIIWI